ncbi:hypothetical protein CI109_105221 [Kwoniella shandongensis]|uniref:Uncharacterized protein n=1 Tax=Kwoniella shandongensis TaxID=1734106 RepID=A0A5M6C3B9_9TREE|nr:uncharacterized protein CI109_002063 [Kwoniella shandongensis]KAA5529638.1 hypothetical protein CI109_002063 [Kwoniella shandongensis]
MSTRRGDENLIAHRRAPVHSSIKKLGAKENVIGPHLGQSAQSLKTPGKSTLGGTRKSSSKTVELTKDATKSTATSTTRRAPLSAVPGTVRPALSSKPTGPNPLRSNIPAPPPSSTQGKSGGKPSVASVSKSRVTSSTPAAKSRLGHGTHTPATKTTQRTAKRTLNVYTPAPAPKSMKRDEVDDVEYMPPPVFERPYEPPTPMRGPVGVGEDDDLFTSTNTQAPELDLDLGTNDQPKLRGIKIKSHMFGVPSRQESLVFDDAPPDDFLFDL